MEIFNSAVLNEKGKGEVVSGVVMIKGYSVKKTRNGKDYIDGDLQCGSVCKFKIWSGTLCDSFINEEYSGCICNMTATVDDYNGVKSLIFNECVTVDGFDKSQFMEVRYNKESYWEGFKQLLDSNLSDKGKHLMNELFYSNTELTNRFKEEFCAKSHHDNCLSGLLAHSYKMLYCMHCMLPLYKDLLTVPSKESTEERKDLIFIGVALHDIGKTKEMKYGVYQPNSSVTHRFFGAEFLAQNKELIIEIYNEKWYYDLVSVMLQHHGEYGDPCRTWASYLVNLVDMFESRLQGFCQIKDENAERSTAGLSIWVDNANLSL